MAIFEKTIRNQNFDTLLRKLEHAIPDSSWSAELEAGSDFKEGSARCIEELPCVINFDLPFVAEDYVHRIGRTGRAGSKGEALSLYSEKDERLLKEIEKLIKRQLPMEKLSDFERGKHSATEAAGTAYGKRFDRSPYKSVGLEKKSKDPWFDQPYVPSSTNSDKESDKPALKTVKKPVAALLGGLPKPKK